MNYKKLMILVVVLLAMGAVGFYGYFFIKREIQKRAIKQAIESGCELVIKKFEEEHEDIAEDVSRLMDHISQLDDGQIVEELQKIHDSLQQEELYEDLLDVD